MTKIYLFLIAIVTIVTASSCLKEDPALNDPINIELTLRNEAGDSIPGATVKFYKTETDMKADTNQFGPTQTSDDLGKVTLHNVAGEKAYYFTAVSDCRNNQNSITSVITDAKKTTKDVILGGTGTFKFATTSTDSFRVYINQRWAFEGRGPKTTFLSYKPTGLYDVRVIQIGGSNPIDNFYTVQLNCGDTLIANYP